MTDEEFRARRMEAVRLGFATVSEFERRASRTDWLALVASVMFVVVASVLTARTWYGGLALGMTYGVGVFAGGVMWLHRMRKRQFEQLKGMYHEIELQNMIIEEEG